MAVKTLLETYHQQVFWCICSLSSFEAVGFECLLWCPNTVLTICLRNVHLGGKIPVVTQVFYLFREFRSFCILSHSPLYGAMVGVTKIKQYAETWNTLVGIREWVAHCIWKKCDHRKADRSTCCLLQKIERQKKNIYACERKKGRQIKKLAESAEKEAKKNRCRVQIPVL